jgi:hypothetical protein
MRSLHNVAMVGIALCFATASMAQNAPTAKGAGKASAKTAAQVASPAPPPIPTLTVANAEQLLAAAQAYLGAYDCEFKQELKVEKHRIEGYMDVTFSKKTYTMKPVRSSTGALRLEEVGGGPMLLVQIPTKSMLMDTVRGRRIVDACVNEVQAKEASTDANALGMNLPGQVDTTTTAAKK